MDALKTSLLVFIVVLSEINADIIVETSLGKVAGVKVNSIIENEKYYSFMGIPYGKPPVGELRFRPPQPHDGWGDILDAKRERKPCAQNNLPIRPIKIYGYSGEEDCLNLSVHTPKLPHNEDLDFPVIVFLYNEQFKLTHNGTRDYGPDFLMKEDVIFVTINHRVGPLGFIAFEDALLPGNNGLRDVILALKWLQQNIHKFGGDPYKITLMGVDGGAALADMLLHSPKAKGLFSAIILQGDTSWNSMYFPKRPRQTALNLAKELEKKVITSAHLIEEFLNESAYTIVSSEYLAVDTDEGRHMQRAIIPFSPVIEQEHPEAVITKLPEETELDIDIPIMMGYNSRIGIELCERYLRKPQYLTFADRDFLFLLPVRVNYHFKVNTNIIHKAMQEIKDFYFDEGYIRVSNPGEYLTYAGDVVSFLSVDYALRKYVNESKSPVYYYTFDYAGELNVKKNKILEDSMNIEGTWGAVNGDDLCYLFVCKSIRKAYKKVLDDPDCEEAKVIKNMVKMWTNFAKFGNPTPAGSQVTWPAATKEKKECLVINDEPQVKQNLFQDRVDFWDTFIAKYEKLAVDGVIKDEKDEL